MFITLPVYSIDRYNISQSNIYIPRPGSKGVLLVSVKPVYFRRRKRIEKQYLRQQAYVNTVTNEHFYEVVHY